MIVVERKELVIRIEVFIVFAVAALDLSVMPGRERFNAFVLNAKLIQRYFKECFLIRALRVEPIGELRAVVCLYTFNCIWEASYAVLNEL